jgi:hypothetical protein
MSQIQVIQFSNALQMVLPVLFKNKLLIVVHFATYNHHKPQNARKLVLHGTENS